MVVAPSTAAFVFFALPTAPSWGDLVINVPAKNPGHREKTQVSNTRAILSADANCTANDRTCCVSPCQSEVKANLHSQPGQAGCRPSELTPRKGKLSCNDKTLSARRSAMPELPEVEAARAILAEHCEGRKIIAVDAQEDASASTTRLHGSQT